MVGNGIEYTWFWLLFGRICYNVSINNKGVTSCGKLNQQSDMSLKWVFYSAVLTTM